MGYVKSSFCTTSSCVEVEYVRSSFCSLSNCVEVGYVTSSFSGGSSCVQAGAYIKSSKCSAGGCVEVAEYHKSSHSTNGTECVAVADVPDGVFVRDSKHPDEPPLSFTRDEWAAFLYGVDNGEFV